MLAVEILPDKHLGGLDVLSLMLDAKRIIAAGKREKEGCSPASKRIKHAQATCKLFAIGSRENRDIEQHMGEQFIGLALVTARLRHFERHEWRKWALQRAQKGAGHISQVFKILVCFAGRSQPRQNFEPASRKRISQFDQHICLPGQFDLFNALNSGTKRTGKQLRDRQSLGHVGILSAALRCNLKRKFHIRSISLLRQQANILSDQGILKFVPDQFLGLIAGQSITIGHSIGQNFAHVLLEIGEKNSLYLGRRQ